MYKQNNRTMKIKIQSFSIWMLMMLLGVALATTSCSDEEESANAVPTVTGFSPESTSVGEETTVTITGTNLQNVGRVKIGADIVLTDDAILSTSGTEVKVKFIPEAMASGLITVITPVGSARSENEFTVKHAIVPAGTPVVLNGDDLKTGESYSEIEITGEDLDAVTRVILDETEAGIVLQEPERLVVTLPYLGGNKTVTLALKYMAPADGEEDFGTATEAEVVVRTDFYVTEPSEGPTVATCDESVINGYPFTITGKNLHQIEAVYLNDVADENKIAFSLEQDEETDRMSCTINPEIITRLTGNAIIVRYWRDVLETLTEEFEIRLTEPVVNPLETTAVEALVQFTLDGESLNIIEVVTIGGKTAAIVTPEGGRINTELTVAVPFFEEEEIAAPLPVVLKYKDITAAEEADLLAMTLEQQLTVTMPVAPVVTLVPESATYNHSFTLEGTCLDKVEAVYLNAKADANRLPITLEDGKLVCSLLAIDLPEGISIHEGKNVILIEYWNGNRTHALPQQIDIRPAAPEVTSLSATSVAALGELTLNGENLRMVNKVTIGGVEIAKDAFKSQAATALTVMVPYFAETGAKTLTVTYANAMAGGEDADVSYAPGVTVTEPAGKPEVTALSYDGKSATFDITGANLNYVEKVLLGSTKVTVSAATATKLTCALPDNTAEGSYDVSITYWAGNKTEQLSQQLTVAYVPTMTGMVDASGKVITEIELAWDAENTTFTFVGTHLDKITGITLDGNTIGSTDITVSEDKTKLSFILAKSSVTIGSGKTFIFSYGDGKSLSVSDITINAAKANYIHKNVVLKMGDYYDPLTGTVYNSKPDETVLNSGAILRIYAGAQGGNIGHTFDNNTQVGHRVDFWRVGNTGVKAAGVKEVTAIKEFLNSDEASTSLITVDWVQSVSVVEGVNLYDKGKKDSQVARYKAETSDANIAYNAGTGSDNGYYEGTVVGQITGVLTRESGTKNIGFIVMRKIDITADNNINNIVFTIDSYFPRNYNDVYKK